MIAEIRLFVCESEVGPQAGGARDNIALYLGHMDGEVDSPTLSYY